MMSGWVGDLWVNFSGTESGIKMSNIITQKLSNGIRVKTAVGEGTVDSVTVMLGKSEDGKESLKIPQVTVKLDKPVKGEDTVTVPITDISLQGKKVFKKPTEELWDDDEEGELGGGGYLGEEWPYLNDPNGPFYYTTITERPPLAPRRTYSRGEAD